MREIEDAVKAVLNLHGTLPTIMCKVVDQGWCEGGSRKANMYEGHARRSHVFSRAAYSS